MNQKPAGIQLSVLQKHQLVRDDSSLLERYFLADYINSMLRQKFNFTGFELRPYGSAVTGFANKYSDVDLCVIDKFPQKDFSASASYQENFQEWRKEARVIMIELYEAMNPQRSSSCLIPGIISQQLLSHAKHPIIKSEFAPLNLEFDFSYMDPSLLSMAKLHNYFSSLDARIIPFIGTIRLWARLSGISSHGLSGQVSPYIMTQLALNYLQSIEFIPKIKDLKSDKPELHLGEDVSFEALTDWKCELKDSKLERDAAELLGMTVEEYRQISPLTEELRQEDSLHIMLYGFLAWIEDFEQKHYYICSLRSVDIYSSVTVTSSVAVERFQKNEQLHR